MSGIGWIDLSEADLQQARQVLASADGEDTVDQLGLGALRDGLSDRLFPATSTIMTEVRYYVFVPTMFRHLEDRRSTGMNIADASRQLEIQIRRRLVAGCPPGTTGIFGVEAERLRRWPSDVYWAGLRTLDILRFSGSKTGYFSALSPDYYQRVAFRRRRGSQKLGLEHDQLERPGVWDEKFPTNWSGLGQGLTFELTAGEGLYLQRCYERQFSTSLFTWLLRNEAALPGKTEGFWFFDGLPGSLKCLVDYAQRFSYLHWGAQLLYNVLVDELTPQKAKYDVRAAFVRWFEGAEIQLLEDSGWDWEDFRVVLERDGHTAAAALDFAGKWRRELLMALSPQELFNSPLIKRLFMKREHDKKGLRARLRFPDRDRRTYNFPNHRLLFRWPTAHSFITRIRAAVSSV